MFFTVLYTLGGKFHAILSAVNEEVLSWPSGALFELANVNIWLKFLSVDVSTLIKIEACLVYFL